MDRATPDEEDIDTSSNRARSKSPGNMRFRGATATSSRKRAPFGASSPSKNERGHATNINTINVINNFAVSGSEIPWPKKRKNQVGWTLLRVFLAIMIVLWAGLMVSILSQHTHALDAARMDQWRQLGINIKRTLRNKKKQKAEQHEESDLEAEPAVEPVEEPVAIASFFELSMFGNTSPSDFQRYTPNAPSCTEPLDADGVSYTLVSQLSNDRLWMVRYHCERWGDNPISIVVFSDRSSDDIKTQLIREGCYEPGLTVQVVSKSRYDPSGKEYPVNILRNMAISAVKTSHIVYADIDFWPSADLHDILSKNEMKERFAKDAKLATIIPVFQMFRRCKEYKDCQEKNIPMMPKDKESLINLIKKREASTFDPTNIGGHGSTKYITWRDQSPATFVELPCIKSNRYEPYLTFRYCSELPPFQEGFTGYGKNKMTWVMQLRRTGYLFTQLGGAFLTHYPHLDSKARLEWNKKPKQVKSVNDIIVADDTDLDLMKFKRARVDALFLDFKEWMDGTVEDDSRTQLCIDSLNDDVRLWVHNVKDEDGEVEENADDLEGENSQPSDPESGASKADQSPSFETRTSK